MIGLVLGVVRLFDLRIALSLLYGIQKIKTRVISLIRLVHILKISILLWIFELLVGLYVAFRFYLIITILQNRRICVRHQTLGLIADIAVSIESRVSLIRWWVKIRRFVRVSRGIRLSLILSYRGSDLAVLHLNWGF